MDIFLDALRFGTPLLLIVTGAALIWVTYRDIVFPGVASENWPTVSATITESVVLEQASGENKEFRPFVCYDYEIDGRVFHGQCSCFGDYLPWPWRGDADAMVKRFPIDAVVPVFVNPNDVTESVLEPGVSQTIVIPIAGAYASIVIGAYLSWSLLF